MDAVTATVAEGPAAARSAQGGPVQDGTAPLLKCGLGTLAAGIATAVSIPLFFGGIGEQGPHTNLGWLMLIVAMMCLPFGTMLTLLGTAKWLRNRRRGG